MQCHHNRFSELIVLRRPGQSQQNTIHRDRPFVRGFHHHRHLRRPIIGNRATPVLGQLSSSEPRDTFALQQWCIVPSCHPSAARHNRSTSRRRTAAVAAAKRRDRRTTRGYHISRERGLWCINCVQIFFGNASPLSLSLSHRLIGNRSIFLLLNLSRTPLSIVDDPIDPICICYLLFPFLLLSLNAFGSQY